MPNTEWRLLATTVPKEIVYFMTEVFQIYEIRANVGKRNGVQFVVHSNEANHSIPHIHAKYGEFEVSISLKDGAILAGNLPKKQVKVAQEWVASHKAELENQWKDFAVSATSQMTLSRLGTADSMHHA
jgi:hypothetical protein